MTTDVRDAPDRSRYEVTVDGDLAGFAEYKDRADAREFTHTEVFDAYEGKGVGSVLARGALDAVRAAGTQVVATCPFIARYIERHEEYQDLLHRVD
jgi:predicted GNAT family acetyltransferase